MAFMGMAIISIQIFQLLPCVLASCFSDGIPEEEWLRVQLAKVRGSLQTMWVGPNVGV